MWSDAANVVESRSKPRRDGGLIYSSSSQVAQALETMQIGANASARFAGQDFGGVHILDSKSQVGTLIHEGVGLR